MTMSPAEEKEIIERIVCFGEKDLFRRLVEENASMILNMIVRMTGNSEDARDIAQESFVKAYFSLGKYRGESSFSTWLYAIAYNCALSSLRKRRRFFPREKFTDRELAEGESLFDDSGEEVSRKRSMERKYDLIDSAFEKLSPSEKFLVGAFYRDGRSIREICGITGLSVSNIKVRLHRLRARIGELIEKTEYCNDGYTG